MTSETTMQVWQPTPEDDGGLGLDPTADLRLEFVQINGQIGLFTFGRDRTKGEKIVRMVLLAKLPNSRAYFQKGKLSDPICSSDNGIMPISLEQAQAINAGPTCKVCQFGQWHGRREKPECGENYNILAARPPDENGGEPFPYILRLRGTSIPIMQSLFSELERLRHTGPQIRPAFAYIVELTNEHVKREDQNFYKLVARIVGESDPRDWYSYDGIRKLYRERVNQVLSASAEAERIEAQTETRTAGPVAERGATEPQIKFIGDLADRLGIDPVQLHALANNKTAQQLTRQEASALIETLKQIENSEKERYAAETPQAGIGEPDTLPFAPITVTSPDPAAPDPDASSYDPTPPEALDGATAGGFEPATNEPEEYEPPFPVAVPVPVQAAAIPDIVPNLDKPADAATKGHLRTMAAQQQIAEADFERWCKSLYKKPLDELTIAEAQAFYERLEKRASNIAASPQATATKTRVATSKKGK